MKPELTEVPHYVVTTRVFPHNAAVNKSLVIIEQAEIITVKAPR